MNGKGRPEGACQPILFSIWLYSIEARTVERERCQQSIIFLFEAARKRFFATVTSGPCENLIVHVCGGYASRWAPRTAVPAESVVSQHLFNIFTRCSSHVKPALSLQVAFPQKRLTGCICQRPRSNTRARKLSCASVSYQILMLSTLRDRVVTHGSQYNAVRLDNVAICLLSAKGADRVTVTVLLPNLHCLPIADRFN